MGGGENISDKWCACFSSKICTFYSPFFYIFTFPSPMRRQAYESLLSKYGVELSFHGHVHAYERTLSVNDYVVSSSGTMHATIGSGGTLEAEAVVTTDQNYAQVRGGPGSRVVGPEVRGGPGSRVVGPLVRGGPGLWVHRCKGVKGQGLWALRYERVKGPGLWVHRYKGVKGPGFWVLRYEGVQVCGPVGSRGSRVQGCGP